MTEEIIIKHISEFGIGLSIGMLVIIGFIWSFVNLMAYLEGKKNAILKKERHKYP